MDIRHLMSAGEFTHALELLMTRYGAAVYRFCCQGLRDGSLADDVHQKVFIEAHRDMHRYAGRATLRAWLFGIARHRVLDAAKANQRRAKRNGTDDGKPIDVVDPSPGADQRIDEARLNRALEECLQELDADVRSAVLLRFHHNFSFEEMASLLKAKPGTLQARVARALPRLRDCIQKRTRGLI